MRIEPHRNQTVERKDFFLGDAAADEEARRLLADPHSEQSAQEAVLCRDSGDFKGVHFTFITMLVVARVIKVSGSVGSNMQHYSLLVHITIRNNNVADMMKIFKQNGAIAEYRRIRSESEIVRLGYMYTYLYMHVVSLLLVHAWSHQYTPLQRTTAWV